MARLSIALLGPFRVLLDGEPVTAFESDKVRALLAYLALESAHPHRRETLASLLWPEQRTRDARHALSQALYNLRTAIKDRDARPPSLSLTRQTVQFNPANDHWLDVAAFSASIEAAKAHLHSRLDLCEPCLERLRQAADLYRGSFLEGLSPGESFPFEEWLLLEQERLHRMIVDALRALGQCYEWRGDYGRVLDCAQRQVKLEPWNEEAHRQAMRALAVIGRRNSALAQYELCRRTLSTELGVEPEQETTALYEQIRSGLGTDAAVQPKPSEVLAQRQGSALGSQVGWPSRSRIDDVEGERRIVTCVVAQIQGTDASNSELDVESWAEVLHELYPLLASEIARFGGWIYQFSGSDLVVLFGVPRTHDDDPERAVLASQSMQKRVAGYGETCAQDIHLALRAGVHTGEAIVQGFGDDGQHHRHAVIGEVIPFANRIQIAAEPGTILLSQETYRLVDRLFEWQAKSAQIRGRVDPIPVYRPLAYVGAPGGSPETRSPFVGRGLELATLRRAAQSLKDGQGGIVTLVGDAGIGKSRLIQEIRQELLWKGSARDEKGPDLRWVEARCPSFGTSIAYHLWSGLLHSLLAWTPEMSPGERLKALRAQTQECCPEQGDSVYCYLAMLLSLPLERDLGTQVLPTDASSLQSGIFRALRVFIESVATRSPLVVVCEDIQWADPTSIDLLRQCLSASTRVPMLVVCSFRPKPEHLCWQIHQAAARLYPERHTHLQLAPLSDAEGQKLVGELVPIGDRSTGLCIAILKRAEGNPFFIEEIVRAWLHQGAVQSQKGPALDGFAQGVSDVSLPSTLYSVLMARLDSLSSKSRQLLQVASVLGREFTYRVLAEAVAALPLDRSTGLWQNSAADEKSGPDILFQRQLNAGLAALGREHMVLEQASGFERRYTFRHQLIVEAAYASLPARKRPVVHQQVALTLERLYPDRLDEHLGLLAHHWERGTDAGRAIDYLRRAAESAANRYANREAADYAKRALDLLSKEDRQARYSLLLLREGAFDRLGERESQAQVLEGLASLAEELDDNARRCQVTLLQAYYAEATGDYSEAIRDAQRAATLAQLSRNVEKEAKAHMCWGKALLHKVDYGAAWLHTERAMTMLRDLHLSGSGDRATQKLWADSLILAGDALIALGRHRESPEYYTQAQQLYREIGDRDGESEALGSLGVSAEFAGDYARSKRHLEQALCICREIGNRRKQAYVLSNIGRAYGHLGDRSAARDYLNQALTICREIRDRFREAYLLVGRSHSSSAQGRYAQATDDAKQALFISQEIDSPWIKSSALSALGSLAFNQADYSAARVHYQRSLLVCREAGDRTGESECLSELCELCFLLGDSQAALEHSQKALAIALAIQDVPLQAYYWMLLGNALADLGRLNEAIDAYEQALASRSQLGNPDLVTMALAGLANIRLAQRDLTRAQAWVDEILIHLESRPRLEGIWEPMPVYLACYRVLCAREDTRAQAVLHEAHRLLQERAARIESETARRDFLYGIEVRRQILAEFAEMTQGSNDVMNEQA